MVESVRKELEKELRRNNKKDWQQYFRGINVEQTFKDIVERGEGVDALDRTTRLQAFIKAVDSHYLNTQSRMFRNFTQKTDHIEKGLEETLMRWQDFEKRRDKITLAYKAILFAYMSLGTKKEYYFEKKRKRPLFDENFQKTQLEKALEWWQEPIMNLLRESEQWLKDFMSNNKVLADLPFTNPAYMEKKAANEAEDKTEITKNNLSKLESIEKILQSSDSSKTLENPFGDFPETKLEDFVPEKDVENYSIKLDKTINTLMKKQYKVRANWASKYRAAAASKSAPPEGNGESGDVTPSQDGSGETKEVKLPLIYWTYTVMDSVSKLTEKALEGPGWVEEDYYEIISSFVEFIYKKKDEASGKYLPLPETNNASELQGVISESSLQMNKLHLSIEEYYKNLKVEEIRKERESFDHTYKTALDILEHLQPDFMTNMYIGLFYVPEEALWTSKLAEKWNQYKNYITGGNNLIATRLHGVKIPFAKKDTMSYDWMGRKITVPGHTITLKKQGSFSLDLDEDMNLLTFFAEDSFLNYLIPLAKNPGNKFVQMAPTSFMEEKIKEGGRFYDMLPPIYTSDPRDLINGELLGETEPIKNAATRRPPLDFCVLFKSVYSNSADFDCITKVDSSKADVALREGNYSAFLFKDIRFLGPNGALNFTRDQANTFQITTDFTFKRLYQFDDIKSEFNSPEIN